MKSRYSAAGALALAIWPATASAQDAASPEAAVVETGGERGIADIVVTAQRREERLQNVPISIMAVTGLQLAEAKIETAYDLTKVAPTLTVNKSAVYAVPFMRGIGSTNILVGDEPSVATYIDGFYQGPALAAILPFNNVDRIEVLKGPQGTLFGRNATGGLINMITAKPRDTFFAKASVGYGNFDIFEADAYVTGGLADNVRADISMRLREQGDGYVRNLVTGNRIGEDNVFSIRSKLLIDISETASLTLSADYAKSRNDIGAAQSLLPGSVPIGALAGGLYSTTPYRTYQNIDPVASAETWGATAKLEADLGTVNFVSMTQFRTYESKNTLDADGSSADGMPSQTVPGLGTIGLATLSFVSPTDMPYFITQELQLLSNNGGPFSWIVGGFGQISRERYTPLDLQFNVNGPPVASIFAIGDTEAFSTFGQGTYAFDNGLSLTAGLRHTWERKENRGRQVAGATTITTDKSASFRALTYRLSADYRFSPELLVYASASKGFKSGAFNTNTIDNAPAVNPEKLYAYEAGFKADPSRTLRINGTVFYYDYKDIQVYAQAPGTGTATLQNAAGAELYGAELDVTWLPINGLTLRAAIGLEDSRYTSFPAAQVFLPGPVAGQVQEFRDAKGFDVIRTPHFTGNFGGRYDLDLGGNGGLTFAGNVYHNSGYSFDPVGVVRQKDYSVVDGSITWQLPGERASLTAWVKNLTDELYLESVTSGARNVRVGYAPPRTFGLTLRLQTE